MHYLDNSDYIRFNNLWIGPDGKSGIGTYSTKFDFVSGSVSSNVPFSTAGAWGFSASFVYLPRVISMSGNITYNTGTNSIVYISKTNASNLILTIATPSVTFADGLQQNPIQGFSIIFRRTDTNAGYVEIKPSSTTTLITPRGASVSQAVGFYRLNGTSTPTSIRMVYIDNAWYEI
jgi:hypothetical protein